VSSKKGDTKNSIYDFLQGSSRMTGVEEYADHNHIELWEGEKLKRDFYLLNLGRLDSKQTVEPTVEVLDCALPIVTQYNEVAKLFLVNPDAANIEATLDLHPYYLFTP
jgi:hypothetical protein